MPSMLLPDIVRLHATWLKDKPAVVTPRTTWSWQRLGDEIDRMAAGLAAAGCDNGARVGIVMDNSAGMVVAILGAMAAGAVAVPLNVSVSDDTLAVLLSDAGASAVIASPRHVGRLAAAGPDTSVLRLADGTADECGPGWQSFAAWRDAQTPKAGWSPIAPDQPCSIIYSSGTTGRPKGIVHTHAARTDWAHALALALRYDSASRTLVTTGLYSNISWVSLLCTLLVGGTLVVRETFDAGDVLETIRRERTTHTSMVPVQYQRLFDHAGFDDTDLRSMRSLMCCGSPLPATLKNAMFARFPGSVIELYGTTEGAVTTLAPEAAAGREKSVGKPLPGGDLRILDTKNGVLTDGTSGEIVVRNSAVMSGYWRNEDATADAFWTDRRGQAWLRTGDIGHLDADGFLYITDRKKDVIISGGQNIYPADLEAVLMDHPAVAECAVIGIPCETWGETPLGLVVPARGGQPDGADLLAWTNAQLGRQQRLARIEFRASLPRNANGKVLKRELRAAYSLAGEMEGVSDE